ncbi:MAG: cyclopropane-fatty-acyl-phospholipid synthase family protein [Syntrophotaleaceae bacterium]
MIFKNMFFRLFKGKHLKGTLEIDYKGLHTFGQGPKVCIRVRNPRFFRRVILYGDTGFGESYFLGEFETDDLYRLLTWFIENRGQLPLDHSPFYKMEWAKVVGWANHFLNKNTKKGSKRNIQRHYDLSNQFYSLWLDDSMTYSCAIFDKAMTLKEAQENKYKRICEKLALKKTDHVLEIGTGWGGFAEFAQKHYGCRITTITISREQYLYAKERLRDIDLRLADYRDITGSYDKIVSIEMMEALGHKYVPLFIKRCEALLKPNGRMLYQIITIPDSQFKQYLRNPGFIKKHIFPGGELLSLAQVKREFERNRLKLESVEDIGESYVKTLLTWRENFLSRKKAIMNLGFDEEFILKWDYYLTSCAVGFSTKYIGNVQLTVEKYALLN